MTVRRPFGVKGLVPVQHTALPRGSRAFLRLIPAGKRVARPHPEGYKHLVRHERIVAGNLLRHDHASGVVEAVVDIIVAGRAPLGVKAQIPADLLVKGKGRRSGLIGKPAHESKSRTAGYIRPHRVVLVQHFLLLVFRAGAVVGKEAQGPYNFIPFGVDDRRTGNDGAGKVEGDGTSLVRIPAGETISRAEGVLFRPRDRAVRAGLQDKLVAVGVPSVEVKHRGNLDERGDFYARGAETGNGAKRRHDKNESKQGNALPGHSVSFSIHRTTSGMAKLSKPETDVPGTYP